MVPQNATNKSMAKERSGFFRITHLNADGITLKDQYVEWEMILHALYHSCN